MRWLKRAKRCSSCFFCCLVAIAGCGKQDRPSIEAPAQFTPLPSHPPTAAGRPGDPPLVKTSGTIGQTSKSVELKQLGTK